MQERSTKKQQELLSFVSAFIQANGYGPSYREIMRSLGYKSVSTVAIHIDGLITKGYLRKRDNSARSLEVVNSTISASGSADKKVNASQEKWLVEAINGKFNELAETKDEKILDGIYVLIGALHVLGLDAAHEAMKSKLKEYQKQAS